MEQDCLPQLAPYKSQIPQFVMKLYHILQSQQFNDMLCWSGDNQVLIKSGKKLQQKVLPRFFRHKHLSSFIRQLNMYKFNKVSKLSKQKNHMYFKNQYFRRGYVQIYEQNRAQLVKIKRNTKKYREKIQGRQQQYLQKKCDRLNESEQQQAPSIQQQIKKQNPLEQYKQYCKKIVNQIKLNIKRLLISKPQIQEQLIGAIQKCNLLLQNKDFDQDYENIHLSQINNIYSNKNMLTTMKIITNNIDQMLYPSQQSLLFN